MGVSYPHPYTQRLMAHADHVEGSITVVASGSSSVVAVLKPVKPSIVTTSTALR